jgi:hypothetical protein
VEVQSHGDAPRTFAVKRPRLQGSRYNVKVEWEMGDVTFEPLSIMANDDPITCAICAKEKGLLDQHGWKHMKQYVKSHSRVVRNVKQAKLRQARRSIKYKFGYQVPRDYDEAILLDKVNGNTHWQDAISTEIQKIDEYEVFQDKGKAIWEKGKVVNSPEGYKRSAYTSCLMSNMKVCTRPGLLQMAT